MRSLCLMPVYNQVHELPRLLQQCRGVLACDKLLIIDDGSTDGSSELIRNSGFDYLTVGVRRGIGYALILGTKYALTHGYDVIVHMAGNGKMVPSEMARVLTPLQSGNADYVWGSRYLDGGRLDNMPLFRRYAIPWAMNLLPLLFTGKRVSDVTCGYRAYRLSLLEHFAKGWDRPWLYRYEFEYFVLAKVLLSGRPFCQVPISMLYPASKKNYSKITPFISWWSMLKPWFVVGLGLDRALALRKGPL